ncbi:hypothetical protein BLX24_27275 [Arsenicibacter rosenii]|uniref:Glycosyl hydrolases family 2 sugar binding domain-containing protein n=1 Tax=Arsenicibacter rosenii TaxID=1750698 RepID=A0A1S2VB42_9BACT|nr:hypothetical protein BLX24_27275 [Arsenicibacter rosenii]
MLRKGFADPPRQARPKVYWWWLNGNADTVRLKQELRAIKQAGIGGVDIFEIGVSAANNPDNMVKAGPPFMSDASLDAIEAAIREATRLDLEVGLNVASSWNAGGSWVRPEHAAKSLYVSRTKVEGGRPQTIPLPFPEISRLDEKGKPRLIEYGADGKPVWYRDVAVVAIPLDNRQAGLDTSRILVLTDRFNARTEVLTWTPPAGRWEVHRYGCAGSGEQLKLPSANSRGPIIDHFDSSATRAHFTWFMQKLTPRLGDLSKTALKTLYLASYEATGFVWTPTLPAAFNAVNGYPIDKFLPALLDKTLLTDELTGVFQQGYNRTLSELMIRNHYRKAGEICHQYGLQIASEAGGPGPPLHNVPVETLKALGSLDVPRGEFWSRYTYLAPDSVDIMWLVKEIAAAAHIYGRKMVEEEAFTSFHHWQEGLKDLKPIADRAFCEGMNRVVIHGFSHNPEGTGLPGIVYSAGTHFNDKQTWWPMVKPFTDYLARVSYVLQETKFVADVLYYYGDQVPNFVPPKNTRFSVGRGYDYEIINTDVLLHNLTVKEGQLVLPDGARFRVLALPQEGQLPAAVLTRLHQLAKQGAVISGGPFRADTPVALLRNASVGPDVDVPAVSAPWFDYVHYQQQQTDVYLVRNGSPAWVTTPFFFRQTGKTPELWNPIDGSVVPIPVYEQQGGRTQLPLSLPPYGAYFVVFRPAKPGPHYTGIRAKGAFLPVIDYTAAGVRFREPGTVTLSGKAGRTVKTTVRTLPVSGSWQVQFPEGRGAPEQVTLPELRSWADSEQEGVKYFSGIGRYMKTIPYPGGIPASRERVYLDLGKVAEVADVWINGHHAGISWAEPHRLDITEWLHAGENKLIIDVANTWSNRLTGDALTGAHYTSTNTLTGYKGTPWKQVPLRVSGLIGPVTIQTIKTD